MSREKDDDRSRREKRRSRQEREKEQRSAGIAKVARAESKVSAEKLKLDMRIGKLLEQGYSKPSVAKRLGVTPRRIEAAIDTIRGLSGK
jgi:hypothetical protein